VYGRQDQDRPYRAVGLFTKDQLRAHERGSLITRLVALQVLPSKYFYRPGPSSESVQMQRISQISAPQLSQKLGNDEDAGGG
jgi:hypothetical protein